MDSRCPTCATLIGKDRCPFHAQGGRKQLSTVPSRGVADSCPQCGHNDVDVLEAFFDTENRAWHPPCAVIALRSF